MLFLACTPSPVKQMLKTNKEVLEDGMYWVLKESNDRNALFPTKENERIIQFNKEFLDKTDQEIPYLLISTKSFAPLQLSEAPKTETQKDQRKRLFLTLTDEAKEDLKNFTEEHLNQTTSIVVGGQALTTHKIKSVIDGGKLQITRCTDNACEMLDIELRDNVVKE